MAKVQAKKAGSAKKKTAAKKAATPPKASAAKKSAAKKAPAKKEAAKKKPASPKKASPKKASAPAKKAAPPAKKAASPAKGKKAAAKPAPKAVAAPKKPEKKAAPAPAPAKPPAKPVAKKAAAAAKTAAKTVAKAAAAVVVPVVTKAAKAVATAVARPDEKKRTRRPRTRVHSTGVATANWFAKENEKPRPSSFIPAPPRAEAPSLVAAPPASSDRLIRPEDLNETAVRTVPVRVDVEQAAGRVYLIASPVEVNLKPGEGIEWDFRYLGGADVMVEELLIEFDKPSPFSASSFRSRKPGAARPHRQLSGAAKTAGGKQTSYTIRAYNMFKTELAMTRLMVNVAG